LFAYANCQARSRPVNQVAKRRLQNQAITGAGRHGPVEVVSMSGAVQAQEYDAAKWGLALRVHEEIVDSEIERAFNRGEILRTHVMRPTWHFVTPRDIRWLLELTAPRVHQRMAPYDRRLELDKTTFVRGTAVIERALRDKQYLTRKELAERLRDSNIELIGNRLAHLALYAELEGVICSGPLRGKQFTYALLEERAPKAPRLQRDEALAGLCRRYFSSHGPATIRDFVWWSGLTTADARRGVEMTRAVREEVDGRTYWSIETSRISRQRNSLAYLLPIYDEYLVAYQDREVVPHGPGVVKLGSREQVIFQHALVIEGQVAGTWRMTKSPGALSLSVTTLRRLTDRERRGIATAARRFERFRDLRVTLSIQP
jgi:hypothetical protein